MGSYSKDTTLKPSEHMDTAQNPLVKKTRNQLHNGLRFHPNKKRHNFHNGNSDRENNPSLSRGQGQRKPFHKRCRQVGMSELSHSAFTLHSFSISCVVTWCFF
uniref:Uncharacterized protein n=1 Tax=Callorhinchus milii TaxID=7868 RepID=A0A4W3GAR0_CALMI